MTDTPEVNDIPAILARLIPINLVNSIQQVIETDVPNMADEILSLRAQLKECVGLLGRTEGTRIGQTLREPLAAVRLDVLEGLRERLFINVDGEVIVFSSAAARVDHTRDTCKTFPSLTEAADAELLSRREKENG